MNAQITTRRGFLNTGWSATASLALVFFGARLSWAQTPTVDETLFQQINRAKNPERLEGLERGHVPVIHAPDTVRAGKPFEVQVQVGEKLHEMIPTHFIDWVDVYAGDLFLTKIILTPNFTEARFKVVLTLKQSCTLRAIEHCNLHGLWEGVREIRVAA